MDSTESWTPIWSVSSIWHWSYLGLFIVQLLAATALVSYQEIAAVDGDALAAYLKIEQRVSSTILSIAARSMSVVVILEAGRVIAEKYLKRRYQEGRQAERKEIITRLESIPEAERTKEVRQLIQEMRNGNR